MTEPYLQSINIKENCIITNCELYSTYLGDYVSCDSGAFKNVELVDKFKKLDIENRECVIEFMNSVENLINWDKVYQDLTQEVQNKLNKEMKI